MDTRFWGPSAWQLFHLVAELSEHPHNVLAKMPTVLPCKFCRESTAEFVRKHPLRGDPARWIYDIHNMVNHKLRTQCKGDPAVIDPGEDPEFADVQKKYRNMRPSRVPGRDFLFSIAINFPDAPDDAQKSAQREFLDALAPEFPFHGFAKYLEKHPPELDTQKRYAKWMYGLLAHLSEKFGAPMPSYGGYVQRAMYYKSGCAKKSYKGKTCRRTAAGGRTKRRDHRRTHRIAHSALLD
jgi:hypothetical protein